MARKTERIELDGGAWAEMDMELSVKAYGIAMDSLGEHGRLTHAASVSMLIASVVKWSFGDVVAENVVDYDITVTQFNQMREKIVAMWLAIGGGIKPIEDDDEKKD